MTLLVGVGILLVLGSSPSGPPPSPGETGAVLGFCAKPGAGGDSRVLEVKARPCCGGDLATALVTSMPALESDPALEPELVVEFGPKGEIIRLWSKPVYLDVGAIAGDRIVIVLSPIPEPGVIALFVASDGSFESRYIAFPDGGRPIPCPPLKESEGHPSLRCFEYSDLESDRKRTIGYGERCP